MITNVHDLIREQEGCRLQAYQDTRGVWTVGYGACGPGIDANTAWTQSEAEDELQRRIYVAQTEAASDLGLDHWNHLTEPRKAALTSMAYQLGGAGLNGFHGMLAALRRSDWQTAYAEALDSDWAQQTPQRAQQVAQMLLTGLWPQAHG